MSLLVENAKILEFLELVGRLKVKVLLCILLYFSRLFLIKLIKDVMLLCQLQHEKRTGWVLCDIADCESIAGHMYRMGLMTFLLTEETNPTKLDRFKCLQIGMYFVTKHINIYNIKDKVIY